ncbi:Ger(x)C family spore germination protein [Alteribacillus sp. HJP-4]|uniref:Ger(x)C family spore germination protein n=1 Tax=Alteribacillus sp. HJP-4 TaxID=2775394 RepID=UPI0035CCF727
MNNDPKNSSLKLKPFLYCLSLLITTLLAGCWDSAELQDIGIISGIGIDKGGETVESRYRVTVQIVNPPQVAGGQRGSTEQASPVRNYSSTGSTVSEAIKSLPKKSGQLFLPHIQLMVIGEDLAQEGIQEVFDVIERDSEFRSLFPVLIVKGNTAEEALTITTTLESIPSEKIVSSLKAAHKDLGDYYLTSADNIIEKLRSGSLVIPGIIINGDIETGNKADNMQQITPSTGIEIEGLALFKKGRLESWLEQDASRGVTWVTDNINKTSINLDCEGKKDMISVEIVRAKTDIKVDDINRKPVINVFVRAEGEITEIQCPVNLAESKVIKKLEKQLANEIKKEVRAAVMAAKGDESDIFDFGENINIADKKWWKRIEKEWEEEIFSETVVNVDVKSFIRRTGLRTKSKLT